MSAYSTPMPSVVIVGAGISGLSVAYRLERLAPDVGVTILETSDRPGGTIWTQREEGFTVEMGPNGFLDTKPTTLELARDLGLEDRLVQASEVAGKNRYLFLDDRMQALPSGLWSLLSSRLLSWRSKLSLFLERFRRRPIPKDESIDAFARRRTNGQIADVLADALVTGIYAGDPAALSLPACFPRLAALEKEYGSVVKGFAGEVRKRRDQASREGKPYERPGKLWSLREGLRGLIESLAVQLKKPPLLGVTVRRIERSESRWLVVGEAGERWHADAVVLAAPAHQQAVMLADLDPALAEEIAGIPYNRVAVVALGYRQSDVAMSLDGFGYIAPQNTRRDVLGVQWCTSIYPGRAPEGMVLMRAMCGGWQRAEMVGWDDDRLLRAVRDELATTQKTRAAPIFHRIVRWDRAIPQYHVGHLARLARIEALSARHPGLYLTGNAYRGVAMNDCTEQGARAAEAVKAYLDKLAANDVFTEGLDGSSNP